jgi:hypothetical protein
MIKLISSTPIYLYVKYRKTNIMPRATCSNARYADTAFNYKKCNSHFLDTQLPTFTRGLALLHHSKLIACYWAASGSFDIQVPTLLHIQVQLHKEVIRWECYIQCQVSQIVFFVRMMRLYVWVGMSDVVGCEGSYVGYGESSGFSKHPDTVVHSRANYLGWVWLRASCVWCAFDVRLCWFVWALTFHKCYYVVGTFGGREDKFGLTRFYLLLPHRLPPHPSSRWLYAFHFCVSLTLRSITFGFEYVLKLWVTYYLGRLVCNTHSRVIPLIAVLEHLPC